MGGPDTESLRVVSALRAPCRKRCVDAIGVVREAAVYPRISGGRAASLGSYLYLQRDETLCGL